MQDLLNIEKFINITYYINKPEEKNHDPLHRCSENFDKIPHLFMVKHPRI